MLPGEDRVKQLLTGVACKACGAHYPLDGIEVLGCRGPLWFLRMSCPTCDAYSLVAAMVKADADEEQSVTSLSSEPSAAVSDEPIRAGAVTRRDVNKMRSFLDSFDGDFQAHFNHGGQRRKRAA